MKRLAYIVAMIVLSSCGICGKVPEEQSYFARDSSYAKDVEYRDTTIYVPVPVEVYHTIAADSSHLETTVASSDAWVDTLGNLHHNLENKKTSLSASIPIPTTTIHIQAQTQSQSVITKYVNKPLSWWKTTQIKGFWALLGVAVLFLCWKFRKPLINAIKKLFTK